MQELIKIQQINEVDVVDSRIIADELEISHKNLLATIRKYLNEIESQFQRVAFETAPFKTNGGIQEVTYALLTEDQVIFICSLSKNTPKVVQLKSKIVKSFSAARQILKQISQPVQPSEVSRKDLALMIVAAEEEIELLQKQNAELAPKANYHDKVLQSNSTYTTLFIAKEVGFRSAIELNLKLMEKKVVYKHNGTYILYAQYAGKGYELTRTHVFYSKTDGRSYTNVNTVWTELGRKFIHELFNKQLSSPVNLFSQASITSV